MRDRILKDEFGRGEQAARLLRDATADQICDIGIPGPRDDFRFQSALTPIDGTALIDARFSSYSNHRTPRHIARSGMDHYMVTLCLDGQVTFEAGRRSATMQPGDLCLQDMAQASRTQLAADKATGLARVLTLVLARATLAPMLAAPDGATASMISRDGIQGRLLGAQFLALHRSGAAAGTESGNPAQAVLARVIADAVGGTPGAAAVADRARRDLLLAAIKRAIALNLQGELSVDELCRRFQISRATLYRLFEPDGGLWRYIQDQRLYRAFQKLASPATGRVRMVDVAIDYRFASDNTFVRAFRRQFGVTPGEVVRLSARGRQARRANGADATESLTLLRNFARGVS
jgi:AraC-like DNA-binding protein